MNLSNLLNISIEEFSSYHEFTDYMAKIFVEYRYNKEPNKQKLGREIGLSRARIYQILKSPTQINRSKSIPSSVWKKIDILSIVRTPRHLIDHENPDEHYMYLANLYLSFFEDIDGLTIADIGFIRQIASELREIDEIEKAEDLEDLIKEVMV